MLIDAIIEKFNERNARLYDITEVVNGVFDSRIVTEDSHCHNGYSVAKAFTVTALGFLYDEGKLKTDERVYDILKEYFPESYDPKWETITLDQLMLHKIGLDKGYLDIDVDNVNSYGTKDYLAYAFSHKLPNEPGAERVYSDAAYYILSRVVAKKAGCDMLDYMLPRLFAPLSFHEIAWSKCPYGYSIGATGIYCSSHDMAKLGLIYLNGGIYEGNRILSKEWVDIVLERGYELKRRTDSDMESYTKGGMHGQQLWISKKHNCVIAWHGYNRGGAGAVIMNELGM